MLFELIKEGSLSIHASKEYLKRVWSVLHDGIWDINLSAVVSFNSLTRPGLLLPTECLLQRIDATHALLLWVSFVTKTLPVFSVVANFNHVPQLMIFLYIMKAIFFSAGNLLSVSLISLLSSNSFFAVLFWLSVIFHIRCTRSSSGWWRPWLQSQITRL